MSAIEHISQEDELIRILDDQDTSIEFIVALIILKHNGWSLSVEN